MQHLSLPEDCLVVFLDDTGDEAFSDPGHPVFGFGGCAVMAPQIDQLLTAPWREVRRAITGSPDTPLHAANAAKWSQAELATLSDFFTSSPFMRIGVGAPSSAILPDGLPPLRFVAHSLKRRIMDVASRTNFRSIAVIFEDSQRLMPKLEAELHDFSSVEERNEKLPVEIYKMSKAAKAPALEVADFIANAVGGQLRHAGRGEQQPRKDFKAIFQGVDRKLVSYFRIASVRPS